MKIFQVELTIYPTQYTKLCNEIQTMMFASLKFKEPSGKLINAVLKQF